MQLHHYKAISRLASCSSILAKISKKYLSGVNAPRIVASKAFDAADETMGKDKIQFLLKTPKGTKDCVFSLSNPSNARLLMLTLYQGMGRTWSSATEYSPQSHPSLNVMAPSQ